MSRTLPPSVDPFGRPVARRVATTRSTRSPRLTEPGARRAAPRSRSVSARTITDAVRDVTRRLVPTTRHRDPSPLVVASRHAPAFDVHVDPHRRVLTLAGAMDLAAVGPLTVAAASLTVGRRGGVTVDLRAVHFIDASGLGAIVALNNILRARGQHLELRYVTPAVARVFTLGGLDVLVDPIG